MSLCWHLPHQHGTGADDGEGNIRRPEARHWEWLKGEKLMRNHMEGVCCSNLGQTQSHQAWNQTDWHSIASQLGSTGLQPELACTGDGAWVLAELVLFWILPVVVNPVDRSGTQTHLHKIIFHSSKTL